MAAPAVPTPPTHAARRDRPLVGIGLKLVSTLLFAVMLGLIKVVAERVPVGEIVFARNVFALIPVAVAIIVARDGLAVFRTAHPFGHVWRATAGVVAMILSFAAIARLPIADATALSYAAPLITTALAVVLLGERVRAYRWVAVVVGLAGVVVVLSPHLSLQPAAGGPRALIGVACAVAAAFFVALAMIAVRSLTRTEATRTIVLYFTLVSSLVGLATLPFGWVVPSWPDAVMLVSIGLVGGVAQLFMTQSYGYADASVIAPFEYATMIWTLIAGVLVFDEVPAPVVVAGMAVIIVSGLMIIWRERRLGLPRPEREVEPPT
jgi:drug/metabolite transporter (DMT)-like permease